MLKIITAATLLLCVVFQAQSQAEKPNSRPVEPSPVRPKLDAKWHALIGDWSGEGSGKAGSGSGTSSFKFDLQQQVMVRRGHSEYPASGDRPATVHDDLMVIYPGSGDDQSRAIYFDNEGHVIEYSATWSAAGDVLIFISKPMAGTPQFRLVYTKLDAKTLTISFEIAPPDQPGDFKPYVSGRLRRSA